jgi:hypothetical protein
MEARVISQPSSVGTSDGFLRLNYALNAGCMASGSLLGTDDLALLPIGLVASHSAAGNAYVCPYRRNFDFISAESV